MSCAVVASVASAILAVLLVASVLGGSHRSASIDIYSGSTVVSIRTLSSARKKYLHVAPSDGLVRVDGNSSATASARWLMVSIAAPTVARPSGTWGRGIISGYKQFMNVAISRILRAGVRACVRARVRAVTIQFIHLCMHACTSIST